MKASDPRQTLYQLTAVAVGTLYFFLVLLVFFHRQLGSDNPRAGYFAFFIGLGICTAIIGTVEAFGHPPGERQFGTALAVEGAVLAVLTIVAWAWAGPITPPPLV